MNTYLKYKPVWYRIMILGSLIAAGFIILEFSSYMVITKMSGMTVTEFFSADFSNPVKIPVYKVLITLQAVLIVLLPSLVYIYLADPKPLKFLRVNIRPTNWQLLLAALIVLIAIPSAFWLGELNKQLDLSQIMPAVDRWIKETEADTNKIIEHIIGKQDIFNLIVNLLLMALLPAVGEEILFRGLIQKGLIRSFRHVWAGILLSAFIFAFIHFQFLTFLTRFEMGIILGALYWYTGSLWPSILAHFVFNGSQVFVTYLYPDMKDAPSWMINAGIVGGSFLLVTLLIIILRKSSTVSMYEVYDDEDEFDFEVGHKDEYLD